MPELASALEVDADYLLQVCLEAERESVGFENDYDLSHDRIEALNYFKGHMPDMSVPPNRSRAHSTDVADAIETVLPDLVEIFIGGEDVATFDAENAADEAAAKQETEVVNTTILRQNDGFDIFYTSIKDALLSKTGVIKWWWEGYDRSTLEQFTGKSELELNLARRAALDDPLTYVEDVRQDPPDPEAAAQAQQNGAPAPEPSFSFTVRYDGRGGRVCVQAVAPEDFSVARDTVKLREATYCCMRSRPRAQDLIAMGYDADKVAVLPPYGAPSLADQVQQARDTAGEQTQFMASGQSDAYLRQVQITEHFIRLVGDDGQSTIWRVVTGGSGEGGVVLEHARANRIQFAAITPYPMTHRFYGRSVADLLIEIQRIKTALTRMLLDSGYFALNQRVQVDMNKATEFTIDDLLRQEPGIPVRVRGGSDAVAPLQSGALGFDVAGALELMSVAGENRSGILRNSQGLNPDTLHDTATGAMAMLSNAQKRVRMIARIFAETGFKDLWLGVHEMLRTHSERPQVVRLTSGWVAVDPTEWSERDDMTIHLGVGSGGQVQAMQSGQALLQLLQQVGAVQGQMGVQIVTPQNVYNAIEQFVTRGLGFKDPQRFITDPAPQLAAQQAHPAPAEPPNPLVMQIQGEQQIAQQRAAGDAQRAQAQFEADQQHAAVKLQNDQALSLAKIQADAQTARYKADLDAQVAQEKLAAQGT